MPQSVNHILNITPSYSRGLLSILFNILPDFVIAINRILTFIDLPNKKAHKDDLIIFKNGQLCSFSISGSCSSRTEAEITLHK